MAKTLEELYSHDGVTRPNEGTFCTAEEGKARQEFKAESDLNVLLKRGESAIIPALREQGVFADLTGIGDLHACLETVRRATDAFMQLPAKVRSEFDNDPAAFTAAFDTPEGVAKLRELKVVAEAPEVVLARQEAAAEDRAAARVVARERAARVAAAEAAPVDKPKA